MRLQHEPHPAQRANRFPEEQRSFIASYIDSDAIHPRNHQ